MSIKTARELQQEGVLATNLASLGLYATQEDAPDVRAMLLRAVRDQGISQAAAQKLVGAAVTTGDPNLEAAWAQYAAGATPLAIQKLQSAIGAVRSAQIREGLLEATAAEDV